MDDSSQGGKKRRYGNSASLVSSLRRNVVRTSLWTTAEPSKGHHHRSVFDKIYSVRDNKTEGKQRTLFRVQMPKRLLYYTAAVFLVLPLFMFGWKETHMHAPGEEEHHTAQHHLRHHHHDRLPAWMDEEKDEVLPLKTLLKNQTQSEDEKEKPSDELDNLSPKENESLIVQVQHPPEEEKSLTAKETPDIAKPPVAPAAASNSTSMVDKDKDSIEENAKSTAEENAVQSHGDQAPLLGDDSAGKKEADSLANERQELLEHEKGDAAVESETQGRRYLRANHTMLS